MEKEEAGKRRKCEKEEVGGKDHIFVLKKEEPIASRSADLSSALDSPSSSSEPRLLYCSAQSPRI